MEWKKINYNGIDIEVSSNGLIKISDFTVIYSDGRVYNYKGHLVKQYTDKKGYKVCTLERNGTKYNIKVHRAVAMAFIPNPYGFSEVNHKDERPENNIADNLEWCDRKYNLSYGTLPERMSKLKGHQVLCVDTGIIYPSFNEARKQMGHPTSTCIRDCCNGRQKTAYGMKWVWIN